MMEKIADKKKNKIISKTRKKVLKGVVCSNKMQDTIVVLVKRFVKHPKYDKYRTIGKKYKAHSAGREFKIGDLVEIEECRPLSKDKRFRVVSGE